jgi:hypothetical protein
MLLQGGIPHLTHPCPHFLYDPGPYVAVVYCGRFIFGPAEPPPPVGKPVWGLPQCRRHRTWGGFPPCWIYLSLAPSLSVLPLVTLHSWEGPFLQITFGLLPLAPPLFWSFHLLTSGGAFLLLITICWDVMDLIIKKEKKRYILEFLTPGLVSH